MVGKNLLVIAQSYKFPAVNKVSFEEADENSISEWIDNE